MEGKIILIVFPQDNLAKLRPALVLREFPKYGDVLVCGISTQLSQYTKGFDLLVDSSDPDFTRSGLKASSVCRLDMLAMISRQNIRGTIGSINSQAHSVLLKNLADYLLKQA